MAWSMLIVVYVAAELFRQKNLGLTVNDRLAGSDPSRQHPAVACAAQELHLAALELAWCDTDIDQGPSLVEENGTPWYGHGIPRLSRRPFDERLDEQSRPPSRDASVA